MTEKSVKYRFKGHEKFALREGWLNKGILAVSKYEKIFLQKDATDELGVGANMVKSIRYWLRAFCLIKETIGKGARLTPLGECIKSNDIYFEDIFTIWILHSHLVKNSDEATAWHLFFNKCEIEDLTKENIEELLKLEAEKYTGVSLTDTAIKDDISVLLNMYCKDRMENYDPEDKSISPLSVLGIVVKNKDKYSKKQPDLSKLSKWVILYELACIFNDPVKQVTSISIESLYADKNCIGNIYNLSKVALNDYLDEIANMSYIKVDRTAGLDMVYSQFKDKSIEILNKYYEEHKQVIL